ncbi:hypothetical protein YPPY36_0553, partial [Yersinia pestis PY-36]
MAYVLP